MTNYYGHNYKKFWLFRYTTNEKIRELHLILTVSFLQIYFLQFIFMYMYEYFMYTLYKSQLIIIKYISLLYLYTCYDKENFKLSNLNNS